MQNQGRVIDPTKTLRKVEPECQGKVIDPESKDPSQGATRMQEGVQASGWSRQQENKEPQQGKFLAREIFKKFLGPRNNKLSQVTVYLFLGPKWAAVLIANLKETVDSVMRTL